MSAARRIRVEGSLRFASPNPPKFLIIPSAVEAAKRDTWIIPE